MDTSIISANVLPVLPAPSSQAALPVIPAAPQPAAIPAAQDQTADPDQVLTPPQLADKRYQAVQQAAQAAAANVYVVSDKKFTIFKDASGQYITRFTSLRDGKVTYIPEPQIFQLGGSSASVALNVKI